MRCIRVLGSRLLLAVAALPACTTVHVYNADLVETRHHGVVVLQIRPDASEASLVVTKGIGVTLGTQSATFGYLDEITVLSADASRCRAFIVVRNPRDAAGIEDFLRRQPALSQLCLLKGSP